MKINKSIRLVILAVVLLAVYRTRLNTANYNKAVGLANSVREVLTAAVVSQMDTLLADMQWDKMLQQVDNFFADSQFEKVPELFSIKTPVLVERSASAARSLFKAYEEKIQLEAKTTVVAKLSTISQLTIDNLRATILQYTSDPSVLATFESNMALVSGTIVETARAVIATSINKRLERLTYIFEQVLKWKSMSYERFLYHVLRIRFEMNPESQLETWVRLETQEIVAAKHLESFVQTAFFEEYVGDSSAFIDILDRKYLGESNVYPDLDEFFSRRASAVSSILKSQYNRIYSMRVETIDADAVLDDSQKRVLKLHARDTRLSAEASNVVVSSSLGEIRSLYTEYAATLLQQIRVVILTAFLEYEAISFRAMVEGRQTCIVQFFQMRTAIDEAFLFEYSKERSFDVSLTRTDFLSDFELSMANAGESMLSLTRTGYILYMYEDARTSLLARANLFFRDDDIILKATQPLLARLHEDYASIVPRRLQQGIDDEFESESELARVYVGSTVNSFASRMEFSFMTELINGSRDSILADVVGKLTYVHQEEFASLARSLITEALNPFDFAWFHSESEQFVAGDQIRYIDMREHVVDETNKHAVVVLESKRSAYTAQIESLFAKIDTFTGEVVDDLGNAVQATTKQDEASKAALLSALSVMEGSMSSFVNNVRASTMVKLEATLGDAMKKLEEVQGIRLKNFFNTKIQQIKDDFTLTVTQRVVDVYQEHMDSIEGKMLAISTKAREVYRAHVDELLELERSRRLEVEEVIAPVLEAEADAILADYNIVSFGARQSVLELDMRNKATAATRDVATQRRIATLRFARKWDGAREEFSAHFLQVADEAKESFRTDVIGVVNFAKGLAVDIMGHVSEVIGMLERELFHALETAFTNVINTTIGTRNNDLPAQLDLASVVYPQGVMDLTEAPVIPALAFLRQTEEESVGTAYGETGEALPEVDEPSGLSTIDIILALMPWDDWLKGKVDEIVTQVVFEMQEGLRQNTCRHNKPPCREGWVQYTNSWEVECCRFSPEEQGFPAWAITKMLAKEILLALVLDLGTLIETGSKVAKKLGTKKAGKVGKEVGEEVGEKAAVRSKKMFAKGMNKYAGKSSKQMTKAIKLAKMVKGKALKKMTTKVGTKVAVKVGKVGAKLALAGSKFMAKLSLGPLGIALMIFDVVSLVLDLWDPAGYNDAQMAGEIRVERDQIEKYYSEELANDGFDSPLLADAMYNMSMQQQEELQYSAITDWFNEEFTAFTTKNETAFESMPESEVARATSDEYERLATVLDEDPNLATTLIAAKLENVFLQDINVRENHRNPFTDGGKDSSRLHTRKNLPDSGIMEIVLNETGVQAFNRFQPKKAAFMASMKWRPMKRFVKRENDYFITKEVASVDTYQKEGTKAEPEYHIVPNEDYNQWNPFSQPTKRAEKYPPVKKQFQKHLPTAHGSREFGKNLGLAFLQLRAEIDDMVGKGWTLVDVDPEEEFWMQYDPDKSEAELLDRSKYQEAHDEAAEAGRADYELTVHAFMSAELDAQSPEGAEEINSDHLLVAHLAKSTDNWTTDEKTGEQVMRYPMSDSIDDLEKTSYTLQTLPLIPDWVVDSVVDYPTLRETIETALQKSYAMDEAVTQEALVTAYEDSASKELERLQARAATDSMTVQEVKEEEQAAGRNAEADPPDFAVFLNGYGQSSPLYSIYENCQSMGHGVTYVESKGLCNFTREYCSRYGLDFFYNEDLGVYDCELSRTQAALEYIFGTTITRSAKRVLGASSKGKSRLGGCHRALGSARVCGEVSAKHVQNGDTYNYMQPRSALEAIGTLGLSGF